MENCPKLLWGTGDENENPIPKIIWIYWEGKYSEIVNRCIVKLKSTLSDYDIRILNKQKLEQYLPNIIEYREDLPIANYSDIIRLDLLRNYGGVWMDASILITEDFRWLENSKNFYNTELVGFYSDLFTRNLKQPIVETWFLAVPQKSKFINDWYNEFANCYTSENPHQYYKDFKTNKIDIQGFYNDSSVDYLICYLSAMKLMLENNNYRILLFSANASAHMYKFGLNFSHNEFCSFFLKETKYTNNSKLPMMIKFTSSTRALLDKQISRGLYSKKSVLYIVSPDKYYRYNKMKKSFSYIRYIASNLWAKYFMSQKK